MGNKPHRLPLWLNAARVYEEFGLSRYMLKKLGVKSSKLGPSRPSPRLYYTPDIMATLDKGRDGK